MTADELSPERADNIGSSESSALLGVNPWLTPFALWQYKHPKGELRGKEEYKDSGRMWAGRKLEDTIAEMVAEKEGWNVRRVRRYTKHPDVEGMGASLDFEVVKHPNGPGVLELKNVDGLQFATRWEGGEPPIYYQLQAQHQLACMPSRSWVAIGALVGGNEIRTWVYDRHPEAIKRLEGAVVAFWGSHEPPDPDFEADLETLQQLYLETTPGSVATVDDPMFARLCEGYQQAAQLEASAKVAKKETKAKLLEYIKDNEVAIGQGWKVSSKLVPEKEVSYTAKAYRTWRVSQLKAKG